MSHRLTQMGGVERRPVKRTAPSATTSSRLRPTERRSGGGPRTRSRCATGRGCSSRAGRISRSSAASATAKKAQFLRVFPPWAGRALGQCARRCPGA